MARTVTYEAPGPEIASASRPRRHRFPDRIETISMALDLGEWVMRVVLLGAGLVIFWLKIQFWHKLLSGEFGPRNLIGEARDGYREAREDD